MTNVLTMPPRIDNQIEEMALRLAHAAGESWADLSQRRMEMLRGYAKMALSCAIATKGSR